MRKTKLPQFHIHDQAEGVRRQFLVALPVIALFLILFYAVIYFFGMQYTMVVSLGTVIFQVNYKKQHTAGSLAYLIAQHLLLAVLAYIATLNLFLCIVLNLAMPFILIFLKASQFNKLGYFSCLMTFTFLQFMPLGWNGFVTQFGAMCFCCAAVFLALSYSGLNLKKEGTGTEKKCMYLISIILEKNLDGNDFGRELGDLFDLFRMLYQEAYNERGKKHIVTARGKVKYMFAILMQRTAYVVSTQNSAFPPSDEESRGFAREIAGYMRKAGAADFSNEEDIKRLKKEGRHLLHKAERIKTDFCRTATNFFRMYLFILHQAGKKDREILDEHWEVPAGQKLKEKFLNKLRPDTFEMRFAMRMSVVLAVGMTVNMLFGEGHSYWFVMNAFLLLRPMYEDSNYRMRTRFLGTTAGCLIITLILPSFTSDLSHLVLAGILVTCMYTATPGTIVHAVFVTCFSLTMTTFAVGGSFAAFLRMAYTIAAVLFVLVINRFFFPTSFGSQLRYNFQMIFHMHHMYLRILENALTRPLDYWRICDAQIQYHMVHAQIREDLPKVIKDETEKDYCMKILTLTWRMASEIQQMIFHVKHKKRGTEARKIMEQYIRYSDYILNQIQEMLHLKKETKLKNIDGMKYQRKIENEPELSGLMTLYARNLSKLYVLVLRQYRRGTP